MILSLSEQKLLQSIRTNCEISDASHSGIYSICTLVLKLRNLYKWEHDLEPWQEPDPKEILGWIEEKENVWEKIDNKSFDQLPVNGRKVEPFAVTAVNRACETSGLHYGAGYGRSMKPVFFLAEKLRMEQVSGYPVFILGRELARELSSPFAMVQDGQILIRREALRFFLHDQIREISGGEKEALNRGLLLYRVIDNNGALMAARLPERLDAVVDGEMAAIIHHEVGELQKSPLDREIAQKLNLFFAGSVIEFVARGVHDVLADTHELGMLGYILRERKEASLCFYMAFIDGLRQVLFPEIRGAARGFLTTGDWAAVKQAMVAGRRQNLERAAVIREICRDLTNDSKDQIAASLEERLLKPLGLSDKGRA
jgi:hypothetical protein